MPKANNPIEEIENLASKARRVIEDDILCGRLAPGQQLDERAWAERLGISRTPVREAIKELSSQGLVETPPGQRAYIRKVDGSELAELFEALIGLETLVAELAARRISDPELRKLKAIHKRSQTAMKCNKIDAFQYLNIEFHSVIAQASMNRTLLQTLRSVRARVTPYRSWLFEKLDRMPKSVAEHENIIDALAAHDCVLVRRLMREHEKMDSDRLFDFLLCGCSSLSETG
ncbi:MAG: GntR family transcriptional regulator [Rhizobiaceae bacterium]